MFPFFLHIKKLSDEELFGRYLQTGNSRFAEELYTRYFHIVLGVAFKHLQDKEEAKDVVIEVFEKFMAESKVQVVQNFGGWIYITTKNACLNRIKSMERASRRLEEYSQNFAIDLEENELEEEQLTMLPEAIESLNEHQKNCIRLFFIERKSYKEIVEETGYSEMQVKSYIQNGKRNLKIFLETRINRAI